MRKEKDKKSPNSGKCGLKICVSEKMHTLS
jgi:hypothetical protein